MLNIKIVIPTGTIQPKCMRESNQYSILEFKDINKLFNTSLFKIKNTIKITIGNSIIKYFSLTYLFNKIETNILKTKINATKCIDAVKIAKIKNIPFLLIVVFFTKYKQAYTKIESIKNIRI